MRIAKILLLGEIGVGKTSIARRLVFDQFEGEYKATIGTDIYRYEVVPSPSNVPFHFVVWDTDGNFGDTIFRHVYARQADAALVVGDVNRATTLDAAVRLGTAFMDAFPGRPLTYVVNKVDLLDPPGVPPVLPDALHNAQVPVVLASAKTGEHVKDAFAQLAAIVARRG
jgi:Ras-related protein Rab-5C